MTDGSGRKSAGETDSPECGETIADRGLGKPRKNYAVTERAYTSAVNAHSR